MVNVRQTAVAGMFYPDDKHELLETVTRFLDNVAESSASLPKAAIAPHAGYIYSGQIAARVYKLLSKGKGSIKKVILLGASHRVSFDGIALSSADAFNTPFGEIKTDKEITNILADLPCVGFSDEVHAEEHSLEVHLPFIHVSLGKEIKIVPALTGNVSPTEVAEFIETAWGGEDTVIIVSSDLSHFLPYDECRRIDAETTEAIERKDINGINHNSACGRLAICGLLKIAQAKNLEVRTIDVCNSGDTAGDKSSVVGYGAWAFF
ncbi:MAG: AmmeMemoRadiSam system protein B [Alphaproteobacteria bacterium]|nr:AmmeMemoRadiSam system protein B [Alphaproteobacteria bacterium]